MRCPGVLNDVGDYTILGFVWDLTNLSGIKVRAIKPIKKGEEILVNYVDLEEFNYGNRESRFFKITSRLQISTLYFDGA